MILELLAAVQQWGRIRGLTPNQIVTAQSLAWYYQTRFRGTETFPSAHWSRLAVRAVRSGRDLPGCGTSSHDALRRQTQGAGMGQVRDRSPGPDALAAQREAHDRFLEGLDATVREVVHLRIQGLAQKEIARALGRSEGRISQLLRKARLAHRAQEDPQ